MLKQKAVYIPSLDGLRGISILLVFLAHAGFEKIVPGGLGVTIFFFISGYIITKLLIDELNTTGKVNLKLFYIRRLLRLYPALLLMIGLSFSYMLMVQIPFDPHEILASVFYYENYYFFSHPGTSANVCKILWSLAVEEHFYLVFPALFLLFYKTPKTLVTVLVLLMMACLTFRCIGVVSYSYSVDVTERYCYTLTHTRFDSIIYGCMSSFLFYGTKSFHYFRLIANRWAFVSAFFVLMFCLLFRDTTFRNTLRYSLQGLSLSILIPAIIDGRIYPRLNALLSHTAIAFIGKISYSIYLMHMIAITTIAHFIAPGHPGFHFLCAIVLTMALSLTSYYVVERPLIKFRSRFIYLK